MLEASNNKDLPAIPAKRYFTIGEVSDLCGVKPHVLRYWEQEFPQLKPVKRRGNRRYYQRQDVITIRQIRGLLYDEGFTIGGARNRLDGDEAREDNTPEPAGDPPGARRARGPAAPCCAADPPRRRIGYHSRSRSVAQPGSALAWGARGPGFKSRRSDQSIPGDACCHRALHAVTNQVLDGAQTPSLRS